MIRILNGDCLTELPKLAAAGERFHAAVTDPPYHLTSIVKRFGGANAAPAKHGTDGAFARASKGFMSQTWDGGRVAFEPETWRKVYDCLLPGAYLLAFGSTRGYHRMACAIEDAGFELRDCIMWMFGSGFPKSHDVSRAIDKAAGAVRKVVGSKAGLPGYRTGETGPNDVYGAGLANGDAKCAITAPATPEAVRWAGWGSALKPAYEPVIVARRPLEGTIAGNVLKHGCGGLNIDASRVQTDDDLNGGAYAKNGQERTDDWGAGNGFRRNQGLEYKQPTGRWPANVIIDDSQQVADAFAAFGEKTSNPGTYRNKGSGGCYSPQRQIDTVTSTGDSGSAARFYYCAKADANDRAGSKHPTQKPTELMRYLVRLVTPPGGTVLDPFAGSGSTLLAADQLGFNAVGIEMDPTYAEDARRKVTRDAGMFAEVETNAVQEALL